jgi:hypothetical protein
MAFGSPLPPNALAIASIAEAIMPLPPDFARRLDDLDLELRAEVVERLADARAAVRELVDFDLEDFVPDADEDLDFAPVVDDFDLLVEDLEGEEPFAVDPPRAFVLAVDDLLDDELFEERPDPPAFEAEDLVDVDFEGDDFDVAVLERDDFDDPDPDLAPDDLDEPDFEPDDLDERDFEPDDFLAVAIFISSVDSICLESNSRWLCKDHTNCISVRLSSVQDSSRFESMRLILQLSIVSA